MSKEFLKWQTNIATRIINLEKELERGTGPEIALIRAVIVDKTNKTYSDAFNGHFDKDYFEEKGSKITDKVLISEVNDILGRVQDSDDDNDDDVDVDVVEDDGEVKQEVEQKKEQGGKDNNTNIHKITYAFEATDKTKCCSAAVRIQFLKNQPGMNCTHYIRQCKRKRSDDGTFCKQHTCFSPTFIYTEKNLLPVLMEDTNTTIYWGCVDVQKVPFMNVPKTGKEFLELIDSRFDQVLKIRNNHNAKNAAFRANVLERMEINLAIVSEAQNSDDFDLEGTEELCVDID